MRRRRGQEAPGFLHPALEPILARTQGIPIFQEQAMAIAMAVKKKIRPRRGPAGCSRMRATSQRPSGDQRGLLSFAAVLVSCRGGVCPSTEATQIRETDLLLCESVISTADQATHIPVGSSAGGEIRRKENRSSTFRGRCCIPASGVRLSAAHRLDWMNMERTKAGKANRMSCSCRNARLKCDGSSEAATLRIACREIGQLVQHAGRKSQRSEKGDVRGACGIGLKTEFRQVAGSSRVTACGPAWRIGGM